KHEKDKRPKARDPGEGQNGRAADQVTEGQEFFGCEIAVCKLVAEKHAHHGSDGEGIEDPGLLPGFESEARQVTENQWKPGAPDEKLQDHHEEKFEANCLVHRSNLARRVRHWSASGKQRAKLSVVSGWWS